MSGESSKARPSGAGPDPSRLIQLATAYWESQAFLTANRIGLFEALGTGPVSLEDLAGRLGTKVRPTRLLVKACVALGLIEETGDGLRNTQLSQTFLVPGSKGYLGNAIRYSDDLYRSWADLESSLRKDGPALQPESYLGQDPERTRHFVYGMHNRALGIGAAMVDLVDLSGRRRMLDVGGGPGTYSALFTARFPELHARVIDLPDVVTVARAILASMGALERVDLVPGDYHATEFPAGNDVVLISGVFHRESELTCRRLIDRARDSLDPGGLLIVGDVLTDSGGAGPLFATLFGLNMLLTATEGGVHADADVARWLKDAGFRDVEIRPLRPPMPHRLVIGRRPG